MNKKTFLFLSVFTLNSCLIHAKSHLFYEPLYERRAFVYLQDAYSDEMLLFNDIKKEKAFTKEVFLQQLFVNDFLKTKRATCYFLSEKGLEKDKFCKEIEVNSLINKEGIKDIYMIKNDEMKNGFYVIYVNPSLYHVFYSFKNNVYYACSFKAPVMIKNNKEYNKCTLDTCIEKEIKTRWFIRSFKELQKDVLFFLRRDYAIMVVADNERKELKKAVFPLGALKMFPFESLELNYEKRDLNIENKELELYMIDVENAEVIISKDFSKNNELQIVADVKYGNTILSFIVEDKDAYYVINTNVEY